jgi:hypothetical protein
MKGIVFSEFIDMVEERYSPEVADRIIAMSTLSTGGAYTAVGTYDHRELIELVANLAAVTGAAAPALVREFGRHLFRRFAELYPVHFERPRNVFEFLATLDGTIHREVHKLYPDAELPRFEHAYPAPDRMVLDYLSRRSLADLAEGLIQGCIEHYGERIDVAREDQPTTDCARTRFTLTRAAPGGA